jgi:hypothetical protein
MARSHCAVNALLPPARELSVEISSHFLFLLLALRVDSRHLLAPTFFFLQFKMHSLTANFGKLRV